MDNNNESVKYGHSLNKLSRKNELSKITMANQALLKRIQSRQPTYDHLRWEEERRRNEEYLRNISEFPEGLTYLTHGNINKSRSDLLSTKNAEFDGEREDDDRYYQASNGRSTLPSLDNEYKRQAHDRMASNMSSKEGKPMTRSTLPPL